jgi:flagellar biosynthesis/type III secretory pathway chaperone
MDAQTTKLKLKCQEVVDLWQSFCGEHTALYELTCDEYVHLLSSDLESLEATIDAKQEVIEKIHELEKYRLSTLEEIIEVTNAEEDITKVNGLISLMARTNNKELSIQLEKYNQLLIDIVERIQEQNKKNQVFLNRAIISLQDLKENFKGKKSYKTYDNRGMTGKGASV